MTNSKEHLDRNIPDLVQQQRIRKSAIEFAQQIEAERISGDDAVWSEAVGPGSYRWAWGRVVANAPRYAAYFGLVVAFLVPIGWSLEIPWMTGEYLKGPPITVVGGLVFGLLSAALLMASNEAGSLLVQKVGKSLAAFSALLAALVSIHLVAGQPLFDWGEEAWSSPAVSAMVILGILALGIATVDWDAPRYRWQSSIFAISGAVILLATFTRGLHGDGLLVDGSPPFSYSAGLATVLIFIGFACMRPSRGIAAFLADSGPGPSLARLLVPLAVGLPIFFAVMGIVARNLGPGRDDWVRGFDGLSVIIVLIGVTVYASRRLQGFYENWKEASAEITSQANVLGGLTEGVCVAKIEDMTIVLTNPQFDSMHGWERGGLIGKKVDIMAPTDLSEDELEERARVGEELAATGRSSYENRSSKRDGNSIWCRANAIVSHDPVFGPVMVLVKTDITSEHIAKQGEDQAERKFRQVFEQSPIGMCLVNDDGSFEQVNASFERVTGYSGQELEKLTFADITHPDDLDKDLELTAAMFAGETDGFSMEKRYIRKDGEVVWILLTVVMMQGVDDHPHVALSMIEDVTERREMGQKLQHLADHDPLTGVFNRRRFEIELGHSETGPQEGSIALLAIDLDNFKFINDSYGHAVGDQMIILTAEMLRDSLRAQDVLARQGGDEFVVVLRDITAADAMAKAEELAGSIADRVRVVDPEFSARVTASIGVAVGRHGIDDVAGLMMKADIAMYEAKDAGRNGTRLFNPDDESNVSLGVDWAGRIREALERDTMFLYAQPIVELNGGGLPHFELFVRMRDSAGRVIAPGAFLPVAERYDLIQEIDRWVIRKAIDTLGQLSRNGKKARLCVNLSGRTVGDPKLSNFLQNLLEKSEVDPSDLIFEVTETSAIGNITRAQEFSARLSELGCAFALDDFGTGFASFYYLKHIDSEYVKIDGEFVRNLATDPVNRLLVKALVQIAKGMGKRTVAEQVEDPQALKMLMQYGVDFVQGYYLGYPKPLEETEFDWIPEIPLELRAGFGL